MADERWRHDPKAPREPREFSTEPPEIAFVVTPTGATAGPNPRNPPIVQIPFVIGGRGIPQHLVRVRISEGPMVGQMVGSATVSAQGTWAFVVNAPVWSGRVCFRATQTWPGRPSSPPSAPFCVQVGGDGPGPPPGQTIDFETHPLRFSPLENWVGGTLAFQDSDGTWVYGVLRRAVEEPSA